MKVITLKLIEWNEINISLDENGCGSITSSLHYDMPDEIEKRFEDGIEHEKYEAMIDALESLILAHACNGIDIASEGYVEGINTAIDAIINNTL